MNDLISRNWLMECVNEGWIKFDTEKDENRFIHLVRDIAPTAQPTIYGYSVEFLKILAITMQRNNLTPEEAVYIMNDMQCVAEMIHKEDEEMLKKNMESIFTVIGKEKG